MGGGPGSKNEVSCSLNHTFSGSVFRESERQTLGWKEKHTVEAFYGVVKIKIFSFIVVFSRSGPAGDDV